MRNREQGSTLLQLLIVIAILGLLEVGFLDFLMNIYNTRDRTQARADRFEKLTQIRQMLTLTHALDESATLVPLNEKLQPCVQGGPSGVCTANCCTNGTTVGFYFVDPLDATLDVASKRRLTGPPASPAYFTSMGKNCDPGTSNCAFTLSSTFAAQCPGNAAQCDHAEHLKIQVALTPTSVLPGVKKQELTVYHFVKLNYKPSLPVIPNQIVKLGTPDSVDVTGDSGHPSETQNFKWEKCESVDPAIVAIVCYPFASGKTQFKLTGVAIGTTKIKLQINDGSTVNNLSDESVIDVQVTP